MSRFCALAFDMLATNFVLIGKIFLLLKLFVEHGALLMTIKQC